MPRKSQPFPILTPGATPWAAPAQKPTPAAEPAPPLLFSDVKLPLGSLFASPLNPRRAMDETRLHELKRSIAANGILQPLMARPAAPGSHGAGKAEIIMGARRHAAAALAAAEGLLPADFLVPCRIRDCTDAELVFLAGAENLGRDDMHPLDEAEFYAALRQTGMKDDDIIGRLGVSERSFYRRLGLLRCAPAVQAALRKGEITLAAAGAFAVGDAKAQQSVLDRGKDNSYWREPGAIRAELRHGAVPVANCQFDWKAHPDALATDPETGEIFFADANLYKRLQLAAAEAKVAELKARWQTVLFKPKSRAGGYEYTSAYVKGEPKTVKGNPAAVAFVFFDYDGTFKVREGWVERRQSGASHEQERARQIEAQQAATRLREVRRAAARQAVTDHPDATRALLLALQFGRAHRYSLKPDWPPLVAALTGAGIADDMLGVGDLVLSVSLERFAALDREQSRAISHALIADVLATDIVDHQANITVMGKGFLELAGIELPTEAPAPDAEATEMQPPAQAAE